MNERMIDSLSIRNQDRIELDLDKTNTTDQPAPRTRVVLDGQYPKGVPRQAVLDFIKAIGLNDRDVVEMKIDLDGVHVTMHVRGQDHDRIVLVGMDAVRFEIHLPYDDNKRWQPRPTQA